MKETLTKSDVLKCRGIRDEGVWVDANRNVRINTKLPLEKIIEIVQALQR